MITGMMARRLATVETDPYWANVYALLPFDGALNQEVSGNSAWTTTSGSTGSASPMLSGNYGDAQFRIRSNASVAIAARQFTIEGWLRPTDSSSAYQTIWHVPGAAIYYRNGKLHWYQGGIRCESAALTIGTVYPFMVSRDGGGTVRLFVNGTKSASDYASSPSIGTSQISIGKNSDGGEWSNCDLDEIRITFDVCRETASYTPRTTPFPRS